jgi:hypothetical protein
MIKPSDAFSALPLGLRDPLLKEFNHIVQNYLERRWSPAELSGGLFCEIVYTMLDGYARSAYASSPSKPRDFVGACRALEAHTHVPRSFQILLPRLLPALYEIRNNRGVGHVGGDVDPNHMDATAVLSMSSWVMAELIRVLHNLSIDDAQQLVDAIAERRIPLVWTGDQVKRVLDPKLSLENQVILLIASSPQKVNVTDLLSWCNAKNKTYFMKVLRGMHKRRMLELSENESLVQILPPGSKAVEQLVQAASKSDYV